MPAQQQFSVTILDQWPQIKLMVNNGLNAVVTAKSSYDTALTEFEVRVRNVLQQAIQRVVDSHKT